MPLEVREDFQYAPGCRRSTFSLFGIQGKRFFPALPHPVSHFTLNQRVDGQTDVNQEEKRFHAADALEECRSGREYILQHVVALFDHGLPGRKDVVERRRREVSPIGHQRENPIDTLVIFFRFQDRLPGETEAGLCFASPTHGRTGASPLFGGRHVLRSARCHIEAIVSGGQLRIAIMGGEIDDSTCGKGD
ncbi:hypothetical protein HKBW3S42_00782 [Candidatus Hakubella thermalkaliphila]|uniref:Uncharacterized protein n=1 Tax=Candidatus Hakubella thermalkaliphila TaxID=2754717 RepID=A0A6V8PJM7_9ACTN|nr:hypothetical protein HKBW3S42_00782 [Candidatus Hakubella thermalkaliphila]